MTLASLRLCTDSSEPSLLDNAYCTRLIFRIDTMLQLVHVPNDDDACISVQVSAQRGTLQLPTKQRRK